MKVKTNILDGAALDWVVAKCEGRPHSYVVADVKGQDPFTAVAFTPSTDWAQGGAIIEREGIDLYQSGSWAAEMGGTHRQEGPTPLIAAMRCYVASCLGDEVDIPENLL